MGDPAFGPTLDRERARSGELRAALIAVCESNEERFDDSEEGYGLMRICDWCGGSALASLPPSACHNDPTHGHKCPVGAARVLLERLDGEEILVKFAYDDTEDQERT